MSDKCQLPDFQTVLSETTEVWVGSGVTKRKQEMTVYVYAVREGGGAIRLCPLGADWFPLESESRTVGEDFLDNFRPEPLIFHNKVRPALERVASALDKGDRLRKAERYESAEQEYREVLAFSPNNVRATFGLGIACLGRGCTDSAQHVFDDLLAIEEAFEPRYKHLFNEFGIALRRSGLRKNALKFYLKALALGRSDDHLLFNVARVLYDLCDYDRSVDILNRALSLNPQFGEARKLLSLVERKRVVESA